MSVTSSQMQRNSIKISGGQSNQLKARSIKGRGAKSPSISNGVSKRGNEEQWLVDIMDYNT